MKHVISRKIGPRTFYWNGTGWCRDRQRARIYNEHDARQTHKDMTLDSIMADIRQIRKK